MSFNKEYMPGYTGHVPTKVDQFGMTAGDVNRSIIDFFNPMHTPVSHRPEKSPTMTLYSKASLQSMTHKNKPYKNVFGNCSRYATTWIGGHQHEMCQQHIPGYDGHVPGLISENVHAKSFAKCTQATIGQRMPRGHEVAPKIRFMSTQRSEYTEKNHRRICKCILPFKSSHYLWVVDNPEFKPLPDYADYTKFINNEYPR
jgi:hypothetical protein